MNEQGSVICVKIFKQWQWHRDFRLRTTPMSASPCASHSLISIFLDGTVCDSDDPAAAYMQDTQCDGVARIGKVCVKMCSPAGAPFFSYDTGTSLDWKTSKTDIIILRKKLYGQSFFKSRIFFHRSLLYHYDVTHYIYCTRTCACHFWSGCVDSCQSTCPF